MTGWQETLKLMGAVWLSPRRAVRRVLDAGLPWPYLLPLVLVYGISFTMDQISFRNLADFFLLRDLLLFSLLIGIGVGSSVLDDLQRVVLRTRTSFSRYGTLAGGAIGRGRSHGAGRGQADSLADAAGRFSGGSLVGTDSPDRLSVFFSCWRISFSCFSMRS